jgi:hypothetical protein
MPVKRHLKEDATTAPTISNDSFAKVLDGGAPASAAVARIPEAIVSGNVRERDPAPPPYRDSMRATSQRLGARFWATNKRFEWARAANLHHYEFTRYYFEELVLVDVWPNANPSARKEVEKKRACVDAENERRVERKEKPIGYLPIVRGAIVSDECFDAALNGQTFALIERALEGVLV